MTNFEELKTETVISEWWLLGNETATRWWVRETFVLVYYVSIFSFNHMYVLLLLPLVTFKSFLFIFDVTHVHYLVLINMFIFIPPTWSNLCFFLNPENYWLFHFWTTLRHYVFLFCLSLVSQFSHIRKTIRVYLNFLFFPPPYFLTSSYFFLFTSLWYNLSDFHRSVFQFHYSPFSWTFFISMTIFCFLEFLFQLLFKLAWSSFTTFLFCGYFLFWIFLLLFIILILVPFNLLCNL